MSSTVLQNRRAYQRRPLHGKVMVSCHKGSLDAPNLALSASDISETGLRITIKEPLAKWQEVAIALVNSGSPRTTSVTGTVVWSEPTADGAYLIGVHLAKPLPYAELQKMTG